MKKLSLLLFVGFLSSFACAVWDQTVDLDGNGTIGLGDFAIVASHWLETDPALLEPAGMEWVTINDPGFNGQMSIYETTNAQYCQFLNAALASGDIFVDVNYVKGAVGSNTGADFAGEVYYYIAGAGDSINGVSYGGAARINYSLGSFTVDSGFENHPATYISWHGASAFCNYYGWRLPTQGQWQAAADFDGTYTYGCGTGINNSIANYTGSTHPYGTTAVGVFGSYGYGMADMAGNVYEWTDSVYSGSYRIFLGGSWAYPAYNCEVLVMYINVPSYTSFYVGFRVCR